MDVLLQNPKDLCCNPLKRLVKGFKHSHLPLLLSVLDLLDHRAQEAEQPVQQPGPIAKPSLALGSTQN
jgi:hypothetical protein